MSVDGGRGPGRPRATETRDRILDAALAEYATRGCAATSVQRVADTAGVSKQALQHHFPTKAALRKEVYARMAAQWDELYRQMVPALQQLEDAEYVNVIDWAARLFQEKTAVTRFLVRELLDAPDETTRWLLDNGRPWLEAVAQIQAEEEARGREGSGLDAEAHLTVIAGLLLSLGALLPPPTEQTPEELSAWRRRIGVAARRVILRSSELE